MSLSDVSVPVLVLVGLTVATVGAVGFAASTSETAFAPNNPEWEGLSGFQQEVAATGAETQVVTDQTGYASLDADDTVVFVVEPANRSAAEYDAIRRFAERGGTVVVATSDAGTGNELLGSLGVDVRVAGPVLRDEQYNSYGPTFPIVRSTADDPRVRGAEALSLNHGTALSVGDGATALANSSSFSYLDEDRSGQIDEDDELAARPVVAADEVGSGDVVVVSDPSVFINAMLDHDPNRAFVRSLVGDERVVVLDRTGERLPPLVALSGWLQDSALAPVVVGLVAVTLVAVWHARLDLAVRRRLFAFLAWHTTLPPPVDASEDGAPERDPGRGDR